MEDNDSIATIFPTHVVTLAIHSPDIDLDGRQIDLLQQIMESALALDLEPIASFCEIVPPRQTSAKGIEKMVEKWSKDAS